MEMNKAELEGRLTKDPVLHHTIKKGTSVITFALANDYTWYDSDDNKHKHTDYPLITVWGKPADTIYKYAGKGSLISIVGRNTTRSYQNHKGETVYVQEIVADKKGMQLLATKAPHHDKDDNQGSSSASEESDASNSSTSATDSDNSASASESATSSSTSSTSSDYSSNSMPDDKDVDKKVNEIGIKDEDLPF